MGWSEKHVRSNSESMKREGDEIHFIITNVRECFHILRQNVTNRQGL